VEFLGYIDEAEKIHLMQSTDVFCSPAVYGESFGIVLLEAIACGRPVVAGANPGYASVLQGRGSMGLVSPKDTEDFARRLKLFLSDKGMRQSWNEWGLEYVKQYDYVRIVDQYEKLYRKACKTHRKARD
jgi:phosphatidylinositol alpha-mannosyltransferase